MTISDEKILFSVIIPTYNHARFINKCIDSLISQTYANWEAIIVNNFSVDNTIELIEAYNDPRLIIINFNNNGIIAASRNIGIKNAKGEWICFLDSDDWWKPNKLEICMKKINMNVDFIYHDLTICKDKSFFFVKKRLRGRKLLNPILIDLLVNGNCINNSSVVLRKSLLERIKGINDDPQMVGCEDYNTWIRISQITDKFVYIPLSLGFYKIHSMGISQKDMSIPLRVSSSAFINMLNETQIKRHESILAYWGSEFAFDNNLFDIAKIKLLYSMRNGNFKLSIKSLLLLALIMFKK